MENEIFLKDLGEKRILSEIVLPLINPKNDKMLAGDDCAVINVGTDQFICTSTDRVPSDLISFKLGIIDYYGLGYYLAILNISDVAASGATPTGLLLNFAFPGDFSIIDFKNIFKGVQEACKDYKCEILGGDLSNSSEINLVATSIGVCNNYQPLYRTGCKNNDTVYCSDFIGLTPTAFLYFLTAKPKGLLLSEKEEELLKRQFSKPKARIAFSKLLTLVNKEYTITCMDNTDGIFQSLFEICQLNNISMKLYSEKLPIHEISYKLSEMLVMDIYDIIFAAGADFQLVGTIDENAPDTMKEKLKEENYTEIGIVTENTHGNNILLELAEEQRLLNIPGWNYYSKTGVKK
jgi:thiamine-monophosphate kinase